MEPDEKSTRNRKSINWSSPHVVALLAAVAVAAVAVPAWAQSDDGFEDELQTVPAPPGVTPRAVHAVPAPPGGPAAELPAGIPGGAGQRDDFIVPLPPPEGPSEGVSGGAPPPGHVVPGPGNPFPLSDEQIEIQEKALQEFVDCLRDHGVDVGDPEVGPFEIAIPLEDDALSDEFQEAERECGDPPPPPPPG